MKARRIALPVVNDLNYDQRMQKICGSLHKAGYDVCLIGREMPESKPLKERPFRQIRFHYPVSSGKLFYLLHNLRLFIHYLFTPYDIIVANDLDTMFGGYLAAKLKGKPLVYDAHEYFPELPEVVHRPAVKWIWESLEAHVVPTLKHRYTVSASYAKIFKDKYNADFKIIRNATPLRPIAEPIRKDPYILYQGAVNVGRGVEEMIKAMPQIDCRLIICGKGDVFDDCVQLVKELGLEQKVEFLGFVEPEELRKYTAGASLGFTFFTKDGQSYYYSLANRFFDYFHNGVPQLAIDFPEYRLINEEFEVAYLLKNLDPNTIANAANRLLNDKNEHQRLQKNCMAAREKINWEVQEKELLKIYASIYPNSN